MHGRTLIVGAICALAILLAQVRTAQASSSLSTVAATAAHSCEHHQLTTAKRSLSSANSTLLQKKCAEAHRSLTTVKFLQSPKHHWMTAPRYKKCWQVPDRKWRRIVCHARALLRYHRRHLEVITKQIRALMPISPVLVGDLRTAAGIRECIAQVETPGSSHPYTQLNPSGKYKGRYQYDDGTWQAALRGAQSFYHVSISSAYRAADATAWAQDVVTSFAVLHPTLLGWDPWAECR